MNTYTIKLKEHPFNLKGMKNQDWFFGCKSCGRQLEVGAISGPYQCECGGRFNVFYVTPEDLEIPSNT